MGDKSVCVVVLGDIGRSPRMQYHALSLLREGYSVSIIGYEGSTPNNEFASYKNVDIKYLPHLPEFFNDLPRLVVLFFKALWQSITLLWLLINKRPSRHILVQTPPAIPALAVCWLHCLVMSEALVIDWHNYAFSIMAIAAAGGSVTASSSPIITFSHWFEGFFGRRATANLCVTKAMKHDLKKRWGIDAVVLYDRPPVSFRRLAPPECHALFARLATKHAAFASDLLGSAFTTIARDGSVTLRADRPALLVSSTSWTLDEDFSILLTALKDYEMCSTPKLPHLVCVITGKGPLKQHYLKLIGATQWDRVTIITPWLEAEDYPLLLGSADLGVSLHTSSSGLDLPMKVVDMFGCGLPVLAYNFQCLHELVIHEKNSLVFRSALELSDQLQEWFQGFPQKQEKEGGRAATFRKQIDVFRSLPWHENWTLHARPLFS